MHKLAILNQMCLVIKDKFISVAVRISTHRPDSKPTPNTDMASCDLIKMSLIYFNFHKDLLEFNKLTKLQILHAQSLNFIKSSIWIMKSFALQK